MSVLRNVLIEEKERLEKNIHAYEEILSKLPKGSIVVRKIRNHYFVYRNVRLDHRVKSIYLGIKGSVQVDEQILLRKEYLRIKRNLQLANEEMKKLSRALKVYER
jgi:hypothetical protein